MKPQKAKTNHQQDLFHLRLNNIINMRHELVLLAHGIGWYRLDVHFGQFFSANGHPGIHSPMMIGRHIKYSFALSDEVGLARWAENPYSETYVRKLFSNILPY